MKRLKIVLTLLLLFGSSLFAKEHILISVVSVETKEVKVAITSHSKKSISFHLIGVEKLEQGRWINFRSDITCPCQRKCAKTTLRLKPKESSTFSWDINTYQCQRGSGKFRFVIPIYDGRKRTLVYSESFDIDNTI